jgi:hypothetical protein
MKPFCTSLDWQPWTITLDERKNFVKARAQVRRNFCKSLDEQPCTAKLDELKNVVKVRAQVRKSFANL